MNHELKCWPEYYQGIVNKIKTFEIRKNDRNFQVNDQLVLREFEPCKTCHGTGRVSDHTDCVDCNKDHGKYTGNGCAASIDYIVIDDEASGLQKGYCCMAITVTASRKKYK